MKVQRLCLKGLDIRSFVSDLDTLRHQYHIAITDKLTSETDARRIAILVANSYLANGGSVYQAEFIERKIYEAAKMLALRCDPIPAEMRNENMKRKGRERRRKSGALAGCNPLELSIEGKGKYLKVYTPFIFLIVSTLNRKEVIGNEKISVGNLNGADNNPKIAQKRHRFCL